MFGRIMAVVLTVIILLTAGFGALCAVTLRNRQIDRTLNRLTEQAREIAFLAASNTGLTFSFDLGGLSYGAGSQLSWKVMEIYEEFGGYVLVVDRLGRVMDNYNFTRFHDPAFAASLDEEELTRAMEEVLQGGEISIRTVESGEAAFTVGVPFSRDGAVYGAVLIRTPAQAVEAGLSGLYFQLGAAALTAMLLSAVAVFLFIRRSMKPLREMTGAARRLADGHYETRVAIKREAREITELSAAFNRMAERIEHTQQSEREFVANVSHELRGPVTSIGGFLSGIEDGTIEARDQARYLRMAGEETQRLSKLIDQLLALSRLDRSDAALSLTDFDICELLRRGIARRANDLERKRMQIVCDFAPDPCPVRADRDRMEQVVINLMDNAIRFTPEDGVISLTVRLHGGQASVTIADNGPSIPQEDRSRVFDRFFTADRAHTAGQGHGLGLSICQRIMALHGESIRLLDTESGAAFCFTLKAADRKKPLAQQAGDGTVNQEQAEEADHDGIGRAPAAAGQDRPGDRADL